MLRLTSTHADKGNAARTPLVILSIGQIISWGTLYYAITFIAQEIQQDTNWSLAHIFGAFSAGLFIAAVATPFVGRGLQRHGGRKIMSTGSIAAAIALAVMATSNSFIVFQFGWLLAGLAMAMTLYEAAFATLREVPAVDFRRGVAIVTIVGGFASTLYWPLTYGLTNVLGWRGTLLTYAAMHLFIGFPLHMSLATTPLNEKVDVKVGTIPTAYKWNIILLAIAFALAALVVTAFSSHAALVLAEKQIPAWLAMMALALIGPMQVVGRIAVLSVAYQVSVTKTGMIALVALSVSMLLLHFMEHFPWLIFGFVVIYGAANGVMTVVRGTLITQWFDSAHYAFILGIVSTPAMFTRALAPMLMAWLIGVSDVPTVIWILVIFMALAGVAYTYAFSVTAPLTHATTTRHKKASL